MIDNLPNGWRVEKFRDVFNFKGKSKIKASDGLINGKYPFYTSSQKLSKYLNEYIYDLTDALIFGTGGLASIHYVKNKFSTSTDCFTVENKKSNINTKYVYNYLKGNIYILENGFKGAGLKHISKKYIEEITLPIPPLYQQEKIVKVLDLTSNLIEKQKEVLEKYDLFLKSKFIEMFGDPISNPMNWDFSTLPNLISNPTINGIYVPKEDYIDGIYEMVHMSDSFYGKASSGSLKKVKLNDKSLEKYKLSNDDLLIARRSLTYEGAAKPCLIETRGNNIVFESSLIRVSLDKSKMIPLYLFYYLSSESARKKYLLKYVTKSTISGINQTNLNKVKILTPSITLQNQFASIVEKIEIIKEKENKKLKQMNDLHNSMMQKAFKGEII